MEVNEEEEEEAVAVGMIRTHRHFALTKFSTASQADTGPACLLPLLPALAALYFTCARCYLPLTTRTLARYGFLPLDSTIRYN